MKIVQESLGEEIFSKGYGTEPFIYVARKVVNGGHSSFGGAVCVVQSREELEHAEGIEGATRVSSLQVPRVTLVANYALELALMLSNPSER